MAKRDKQTVSQDALQQKAQSSDKKLTQEYNALSIRYKRAKEENALLREEIEQFNQELIEQEKQIEELKSQASEYLSLLQQIQHEESRLPIFHARASVRNRVFQEYSLTDDTTPYSRKETVAEQEIPSLNVWLVTRNRFVDKIVGHYTRKRDRMFILRDYEFVKRLITIGILPDIIITGAYDFGLDDPNHTAFSNFLDQVLKDTQAEKLWPHEFFLVTLSSNIPAQSSVTTEHHNYLTHYEFVSKFRGLQVTISEVRYFLEIRRCRPDIMEAETVYTITAMGDIANIVLELQEYRKTGVLVVLSQNNPSLVRWALQIFFLNGKFVKMEHTLESSIPLSTSPGEDPSIETMFTLASFDSKYTLSEPGQSYFFPLYPHTVLREMQETASPPSH